MYLPVDAAPSRRDRAERRLQLRAACRPPDAARALAREDRRGESVAARQVVRDADHHQRADARTRRRGRPLHRRRRSHPAAGPALGQLPAHLRSAARRRDRDVSVLQRRRFPHRGVREGRRGERRRARQADRAAELPEQPDRLHADARPKVARSPTRSPRRRRRARRSSRSPTTRTSDSSITSAPSR